MNNNDIFKKLRVALQLRDDQIVEILELVDFRISKGELGNIFRNEDHPKYMDCGDQILRNFLNGLVIHLRGTKENPKNASQELNKIAQSKITLAPKNVEKTTKPIKKKIVKKKESKPIPVVENVKYNLGKNKKK
jgi:energy-coupling factor transporter ATP-binding protein EcfA2